MTYRMFLDDIRNPPKGEWVVVRSYEEATKYIIDNGMPNFVSFDHDLGATEPPYSIPHETGYDFAKWLCEVDMDFGWLPKDFDFKVHSANPVGAQNIESYLRNYLSQR